jgi:hypothetical protein
MMAKQEYVDFELIIGQKNDTSTLTGHHELFGVPIRAKRADLHDGANPKLFEALGPSF